MAHNKYIEPFLYLDQSKCQTMEFLHCVYFDLDSTASLSHVPDVLLETSDRERHGCCQVILLVEFTQTPPYTNANA